MTPGGLASGHPQPSSLSRTCSLPESRRRDDTADAGTDVAHPRRQPSTHIDAGGMTQTEEAKHDAAMKAMTMKAMTMEAMTTDETTEAMTTDQTTEAAASTAWTASIRR